jgi:hypothetical protein
MLIRGSQRGFQAVQVIRKYTRRDGNQSAGYSPDGEASCDAGSHEAEEYHKASP